MSRDLRGGHLICRIPDASAAPISVEACRRAISEALDYLVRKGADELKRIESAPIDSWGIRLKRWPVEFSDPRPVCIERSHENLVELINQTATVQRMLDALDWICKDQSLNAALVKCCHPTTSSATGESDLVLSRGQEVVARFEMSDVVGSRDSNGKLRKDVLSLGGVPWDASGPWPVERLFLATSQELAQIVRKRFPAATPYTIGTTVVVELR